VAGWLVAATASRNSQLVSVLLLTGMQVSELLSGRWSNVDLGCRTLAVPTLKRGRSRYVSLAQAAVDVIVGLNRGEFLFPNPRDAIRHLTTIEHR
jgi:integrase